MDGLIFLFVIIAIVSSIVSKSKTAAQQTARRSSRPIDAPHRRQAEPLAQGVQQSPLTAMERPDTHTPVQPRIHSRVDEPYVGSLGGESAEGMASSEGVDPCHDEQLEAHRLAYAIPDHEAQRPAVNVIPNLASQQALVQAVVMSEILIRPALRGRARP